ncbi:MAG: response regulator transcription factor [Vicingaceae bacterium]|nr:response regulator transcription factor [Vicingaceae bacterium]
MKPKVSIFSKNKIDLENAQKLFEREGFDVFTFVEASQSNINNVYKINPDIVFLDIDIINSDGIELCQKLKKEDKLNAFVIMFTKHGEEYVQAEAYKAGADDYIIKPINARLLIKKIQALLKRKPLNHQNNNPSILSHKRLKIDRDSYFVINEGKNIVLPRKEFEMLYLLINQPHKVFSREEIFEKVWNESDNRNTRIIDVHIRKIREQVGQHTIKTIKGVGYQLA